MSGLGDLLSLGFLRLFLHAILVLRLGDIFLVSVRVVLHVFSSWGLFNMMGILFMMNNILLRLELGVCIIRLRMLVLTRRFFVS